MAENEETPELEKEPEPVVTEDEFLKRVGREQDTGGAIDVDAAHDRSS